jgi:hypothetical protein
MQLRRLFGFVDLGVLVVVVAAIALPPREMFAGSAIKGGEDGRFEVALVEGRAMAAPERADYSEELTRTLVDAGFKDWAVQLAIAGADRAKATPDRWRVLSAISIAYIERREAKQALDYAAMALAACNGAAETVCPVWEKTRLEIYWKHLDAGMKVPGAVDLVTGKVLDAKRFRQAGEAQVRAINIQ